METGSVYENAVKAYDKIIFNPSMQKIKRKIPDKIVKYDSSNNLAVIEVQTQDVTYTENWHTCGLDYDNKRAHSLRIPTFKHLRKDKSKIQDITTTQQVHEYYQR